MGRTGQAIMEQRFFCVCVYVCEKVCKKLWSALLLDEPSNVMLAAPAHCDDTYFFFFLPASVLRLFVCLFAHTQHHGDM